MQRDAPSKYLASQQMVAKTTTKKTFKSEVNA